MVLVLRNHIACQDPDVSLQGSIAIYNLARSYPDNRARLLAAGASEVLQAIVEHTSSSTDAKQNAKDAIAELKR